MKKDVIGIIGPNRAGKDTAGKYIADQLGVPVFQISDPLKSMCADRGVEPTRENLIALGTELSRRYGDGYLAQYLLERAPQRSVIVGMRQLGQLEALRRSANFTLIAVDADPAIRFGRARADEKLGEATTLAEFTARETAENRAPNAQRLFECMQQADYTITNEGTVDELYGSLNLMAAELHLIA